MTIFGLKRHQLPVMIYLMRTSIIRSLPEGSVAVPLMAMGGLWLILGAGPWREATASGLEPGEGRGVFQGIIATAINPEPDLYPSVGV